MPVPHNLSPSNRIAWEFTCPNIHNPWCQVPLVYCPQARVSRTWDVSLFKDRNLWTHGCTAIITHRQGSRDALEHSPKGLVSSPSGFWTECQWWKLWNAVLPATGVNFCCYEMTWHPLKVKAEKCEEPHSCQSNLWHLKLGGSHEPWKEVCGKNKWRKSVK